jgi:hypothetical protein
MFEIFRESGHWCARRSDGLVGGVFRDRAEAERFARMEDAPAPENACGRLETGAGKAGPVRPG